MPTIPDYRQLDRRLPGAVRSIATVDLTQTARSMQNLGGSLVDTGVVLSKEQAKENAKKDRLAYIQADSYLSGKVFESVNKHKNSDDYMGMVSTFDTDSTKARDEAVAGIANPLLKQEFLAKSDLLLTRSREQVKDHSFKVESDSQLTRLSSDTDTQLEIAYSAPDPVARGEAIERILENINSYEDMGYFGINGDQKAEKLRQDVTNTYAVKSIEMLPASERKARIKELKKFLTKPQVHDLTEKAEADDIDAKAFEISDDWLAQGVLPEDINKQSKKIKDGKVRKLAVSRYEHELSVVEKNGVDEQKAIYESRGDEILNGSTYEDIPKQERETMSLAQKTSLQKLSKAVQTDSFPKRSDRETLDTLIGYEMAKEWDKAREYFTEHSNLLDESDYRSHSKITQEGLIPKEYKPLYTDQQRLAQRLKELGKSDANIGIVKDKMGEWYDDYLDLNGKTPTSDEFDTHADSLLLEQPEGYLDGWFSDTRGFELKYADIPAEDKEFIVKAYEANGSSPTDRQVMNAYLTRQLQLSKDAN